MIQNYLKKLAIYMTLLPISFESIQPYNEKIESRKLDTDQFSIHMDDLILTHSKDVGTKEGGIYEDKATRTTWYVKVTEDLHVAEFLTSRVLQYLVPRNTSPVYFIKDKPGWVASKEIKDFRNQIDVVTKGKKIQDELKLTIALDFVRYIDRIRGNLGYIVDEEDPQNLIAACVDYELGFRFFWDKDHETIWFSLTHLDQLPEAIEIFESYHHLSSKDLLEYVDTLILEAEKNKGNKSTFNLSTFREIVQNRLEKMTEVMKAAKELEAFIKSPKIIDAEEIKKLDSYTTFLFADKGTLLHLAASSGRRDLVETLIKSGANLDATDDNHDTPLHRSIKTDQTEIALALLNAGANPNKFVLERPLHLAIMKDNVRLAEKLSETFPYGKWTLIDKAVEHQSAKIIHTLALKWMNEVNAIQKRYLEDLFKRMQFKTSFQLF